MVYCGRPSKGCAQCRAKRTKCDQKRPSCGQCIRARRECSGYRDESDLKFRDETSHVVNKQQHARAPDKTTAYPSPVSETTDDLNHWDASNSQLAVASDDSFASSVVAPTPISLPLDFQGAGFFFHHFLSDDVASPLSYSHYLPAMYESESAFSALPRIVTAIGMAGISNMQMDPKTMLCARQKHSEVLQILNQTLLDPQAALADSTLMTVMLLSLFETVSCSSPQALKSWAAHINGATAIAKARGQSQLLSPLGRQIMTHLRNQIFLDCITRRKEVPKEILQWTEDVKVLEDDKGRRRELELFPIIARLCHLRAVLEDELKDDPTFLIVAKSVEEDFNKWADSFPDSFKWHTRSATPSDRIYADYYHVYPQTWIVSSWNIWRACRIIVHEAVMRWFIRNPLYDLVKMRESEEIMRTMGEHICASVPFVFGETHQGSETPYVPRAAAGLSIMWPLYLVATMHGTTTSMRAWCVVQLEKLGNVMGILQGKSFAQVLKSEKEITAWDRYDKQGPDEEVHEW